MMIQHPPHLWNVFCCICNVEWVSSVLYLFQCVTFSSVMLRCCLSFMHHLMCYLYLVIFTLQSNGNSTVSPGYNSRYWIVEGHSCHLIHLKLIWLEFGMHCTCSNVSSPLLFSSVWQSWRYNLWTLALNSLFNHPESQFIRTNYWLTVTYVIINPKISSA